MKAHSMLFVHPLGAPFARNALQALMRAQLLGRVVTSLSISADFLSRLERMPGGKRVGAELSRRAWVPDECLPLCTTHPVRELVRIALLRSRLSSLLGLRPARLTDWVYQSIDASAAQRYLAADSLQCVYAYEDGAASCFARAKPLEKRCIYDLPIAFYRTAARIQLEERELFPELADSLQALAEPQGKLERKEAEIRLADKIIVPSEFVRRSVIDAGIAESKLAVVPYGAPGYFRMRARPPEKFRALFVGRIGARKGVHYLLEAWKKLKLPKAELVIVGINEFPDSFARRNLVKEGITVVGSQPHHILEQYYHNASVLVLPSLVEGFPLVLLEAMQCGVPVIASSHCGAEQLIDDGKQGYIVPVRNTELLAQRIEWMYRHPEAAASMGREAYQHSRVFSWERYQRGIVQAVTGGSVTADAVMKGARDE